MADPFTGGQSSRASNALQKRQESLKRWTKSETALESSDRARKKTKIQFSLGTVFLSAVSSGDVEEVKKLLAKGADINHQNVDGLTALHQACIDESCDLVEFLVDHGARMDIRDNEGWTALHAAASCGSVEIAQCLLDHGADVAAVNNEGELPLDLAEEEDMEDILTEEIERLGIDVEEARSKEERIMLEDAQSWTNGKTMNEIKDRSGASALHVAASKGYLQVISLLLQLGVDINAKDNDGWTPLHAAVHWGQSDACEILADHGANFRATSNAGSTPIDLAEPDMVKMLEELKKRQNDKPKINASTTPVIKSNMESGPAPLKRRSSITRIKDQNLFLRDINQERAQMEASKEQLSTSPKSRTSRPPSFADSPKEDKENEKEKRDGSNKDDSGSESDTEDSSEESSEEDSEEEERGGQPAVNSVTARTRPTVNSLPANSVVNSLKKPVDESDSEEETGSETEESSEEEGEEEEPVKSDTRTSITSSTTRPSAPSRFQSAPASAPSKPGVGGTSKLLKSPFLDNDKKANNPSSPVSKTEPYTRTSRFGDRGDGKEETKSRFGSYVTRTTADTTSNATSTTTSAARSGISSTPSEDTLAKTKRQTKKVTQRAGTSYVGFSGRGNADDDEMNGEDGKSNDIAHGKGAEERKDTSVRRNSKEETKSTRPTSTADKFLSRRNRPIETVEDKNEEAKIPEWKRRQMEREREREKEKEKEQEKERERQKERERGKEKEKESEMPSYRRPRQDREKDKEKEKEEKEKEDDDSSALATQRARRARRLINKRRGGSDEEETEEAKDPKKNTNLNEENDEKASLASRRRSQETRHDEVKSTTDRIRVGRTTDSKGPFGTSKANTIITETDPQKLKERLQVAQLELQEYKVKLEKALQAKEELERKYSNVEDDLKQLTDLKADNQRLKDENGALIRVISKLSRPPT